MSSEKISSPSGGFRDGNDGIGGNISTRKYRYFHGDPNITATFIKSADYIAAGASRASRLKANWAASDARALDGTMRLTMKAATTTISGGGGWKQGTTRVGRRRCIRTCLVILILLGNCVASSQAQKTKTETETETQKGKKTLKEDSREEEGGKGQGKGQLEVASGGDADREAAGDNADETIPVADGIISDSWVMSAVDANVTSLSWPEVSAGFSTAPASPNASVMVIDSQRFGYVNLRKKDEALSSPSHVCLNVLVTSVDGITEDNNPQTIFTLTGYSIQGNKPLSISAHTILENNQNFSPNVWSTMRIPLPDAMESSWYEIRIEEMSVQGSIIFIQSLGFCGSSDHSEKDASDGYTQCIWKTDSDFEINAAAAMPFIEPVYLSGFGLSPAWADASYIGFYDFSYILPGGETAVKALVGPNGALSFASEQSFEDWEALHFQILASSNEVDVCVEVSREKKSREEAQCVESLWDQNEINGLWVDVSIPLSSFGSQRPWNRLDLVDGTDAGIFFIVTNILFSSNRKARAQEIWVLDVSESISDFEGLLRMYSGDESSGSSHALGWSIGVAVGVLAALILLPTLACIVIPKQPGRRLTSVPLCCVAAHESLQDALEDLNSFRHRFRIPNTVKMKAADKKGWVESLTPEESLDPDQMHADADIDGIVPVYAENNQMQSAPCQESIQTNSQARNSSNDSMTPVPPDRQIMYHTHHGGQIAVEDNILSGMPGPENACRDPRPLYRRSSILESECVQSSFLPEMSPLSILNTSRSELSYRRFSNLQHIDDALKVSCKVLMESSNDLKKLLAYNRPKGRNIRRVASETIDMSVASDYHNLIEQQIISLQSAQKIVADEWKIMRDIARTTRDNQTASRQPVEKIPSRTDVQSMNVDISRDVQITGLIGSGGSGNVYHGLYKGHFVAIKMLHNNGAFTGDQLNALKTEAALLQNLRHPNIVNFLGCCLSPPQICVILEYAEGGSLHHMLHINQKQPEYGTLLQLAEDVASAMDYCHSLDPPIIHRDLKPQNILLRRDGRAQVADFGIARIRQSTFVETKHLNAGTVAYMSPEIMQGKNVDEKCDVYSFGGKSLSRVHIVLPFSSPLTSSFYLFPFKFQ